MKPVPFTISADLNLGQRAGAYLVDTGADVAVFEGHVPEELQDVKQDGVSFSLNDHQLILSIPDGARFLVENGEKIIYERNGKSDREVALFLLGSAWGALCFQRGLLPLHASAIVENGHVHAFTGPSGVGKSTLAAALAKRGRGFFTDDVLIIDPAEIGDKTICYSGQKDLKLWQDAIKLTGSDKLGPVRDIENFSKFYATPDNVNTSESGILSSLTILKNTNVRMGKDPISIDRISGAAALTQLRASVYRPKFAVAIWGFPKYYKILADLISSVTVQSFDRSFEKPEFEASLAFIDNWIDEASADSPDEI